MSSRFTSVALAIVFFSLTTGQVMSQDGDDANKKTDAVPGNTAAAEKNPMGYFLGISVGQQMAQQGFKAGDFDVDSLAAGVTDGLKRADPALNGEKLRDVQKAIQKLLQKREDEFRAEMIKMAALNKEKGELWLKQNSKKKGVKTLKSGVQYKVLKEGEGGSPSATDTVKVHYTGKLTNGTEFDSSRRGEPAEFKVNQVIQGWQTALQEMKVGDKWMLYIPSDMAYGERGGGGGKIGPNEVLVFEVELLDII